MKGHRRGQQGAILVLTAFLLPFIIAFTGMAVDFGSAYVRRSQLQNAADAAVLAGAYQIDDSNKTKNTVESYLKTNLGKIYDEYTLQDGQDFPLNENVLNYNYTISDKKDTLDVTVRSSLNTYFLKLFSVDTIPVSANAKAKVTINNTSVNDDMFNYAMVAAHKSASNYNIQDGDSQDSSYFFERNNIIIEGDIWTNGKIYFNQDQYTMLTGKVNAYSGVKQQGKEIEENYWYEGRERTKVFSPDVWGTHGTPTTPRYSFLWKLLMRLLGWSTAEGSSGVKYYTFLNRKDNYFTTEELIEAVKPDDRPLYGGKWKDITNDNLVKYKDEMKIEVDNNSGIKALLSTYRDMSIADREKNHIFYDDTMSHGKYSFNSSNDYKYPNLTSWQTDQIVTKDDTNIPSNRRYYRIIVVPNDLDVSFEHTPSPSDNEYAILISLNGNIHIPLNGEFHGMVYAPKGTVKIDGKDNSEFKGSVVAQRIDISSSQHFVWKNFFKTDNNSQGTGEKKVQLIQ